MSEPITIATFAKSPAGRETVRIALTTYRDTNLIDMRVCVELTASCPVLTPTAKGLTLNVSKLPELIAALQNAAIRARELRWIGGDE